jgi:hypothetical protein
LCQDDVIRFIATKTVPVALNLYVIRKQQDEAGDFFRNVQKQRPSQYQGLYLVGPDGKVLASHQNFKSEKTWPQEVLADLEPGLKPFAGLKPRAVKRTDPLSRRGRGILADGSASLAIYLRYAIQGIPLRELPNPTIDSLTLTGKELAELAPPKVEPGTKWELSKDLCRRFGRVLGPGDENTMPRPHEVTAVKLTGKVRSVESGVAYLVYEGQLDGAHLTHTKKLTRGSAQLKGVGRYDSNTGRLLSFAWVWAGIYQGPPPYDEQRPYSAVVEWTRDK